MPKEYPASFKPTYSTGDSDLDGVETVDTALLVLSSTLSSHCDTPSATHKTLLKQYSSIDETVRVLQYALVEL
eukprot:9066543-Ditylum_brightwellii.AAC.1